MEDALSLIERQEKKLQLQRQELKMRSSNIQHRRADTALSPDRRIHIALSPSRLSNNTFSPLSKPALSSKIDDPIKKIDEKLVTRERMNFQSTKVNDLAEISKMKNMKINLNDIDTNNKTLNNLKKAPENNLPKSKNENKIEINFSKKKTEPDININIPRDVNNFFNFRNLRSRRLLVLLNQSQKKSQIILIFNIEIRLSQISNRKI